LVVLLLFDMLRLAMKAYYSWYTTTTTTTTTKNNLMLLLPLLHLLFVM